MDLSFGSLFSSLLVSTIGAGLFLYGKKSERHLFTLVGLAMSIYPYFISSPLVMWIVTAAALVPLYAYRRSI